MTAPIIIIGAGQAGCQAAVSLRADGWDGPILMLGDEPWYPYERPPLSKAVLSGELSPERTFLRKPDFYAQKGIEVRLETAVTRIDPATRQVALADGSQLPYHQLLIATGAVVRRLTIPGSNLPGIHYLRTMADAEALRAAIAPGVRVAIVGAGYIGLEVAASARKLGAEVTVVEAAERVMARVTSPPVSTFYAEEHRAHGVKLILGAGVAGIEGEYRVTGLRLADGGLVEADIVVVGIGVMPNDVLARTAGIACDNGIIVDDCGRTDIPGIFAAGDVTNHPNALLGGRLRLESVQNAISQGQAVAKAMLGVSQPYAEIPWFWSDQFDLKLQIAGLSRATDQAIVRGDVGSRKFSVIYLRDGRFVAIDAINQPRDFMQGRKLLQQARNLDPAGAADPAVALIDCAAAAPT